MVGNPECNKERGFKNQLYIELGFKPMHWAPGSSKSRHVPKGEGAGGGHVPPQISRLWHMPEKNVKNDSYSLNY